MESLQSPTSPVDRQDQEVDDEHDDMEAVDPDRRARVEEEPFCLKPILLKVGREGTRLVFALPIDEVGVKPLLRVYNVESDQLD